MPFDLSLGADKLISLRFPHLRTSFTRPTDLCLSDTAFLSLPYQWEAWKFCAPLLHVLESCAFRPGAGGVPQCTMCASHSGSCCTPSPLRGSGELPSSEGLSMRVGELTFYHRAAANVSLPFPEEARPDINHFHWFVAKMLFGIIGQKPINRVRYNQSFVWQKIQKRNPNECVFIWALSDVL